MLVLANKRLSKHLILIRLPYTWHQCTLFTWNC